MPQIGKWGCGPRWRLNMHKFGCWVNRWKLERKFEKKITFIRQTTPRLKKQGCHLADRGLILQPVGWGGNQRVFNGETSLGVSPVSVTQ